VPQADVLLLVDYGNGMCLGRLPTMILSHLKKSGIKTVANTRRSPSHFPGAGGMIVNLHQARSYGSPENLMLRLGLEWLVISEGVKGMTLHNSNESLHVDPPGKKAVVDITGAGDTVLAWVTAGWAAGLDWAETMHLANYAAQAAVAVEGTAAPTAEEVASIL
jgi:bifunctional ADP-heptose synthase (sugar kinase/adenylyltransferase)